MFSSSSIAYPMSRRPILFARSLEGNAAFRRTHSQPDLWLKTGPVEIFARDRTDRARASPRYPPSPTSGGSRHATHRQSRCRAQRRAGSSGTSCPVPYVVHRCEAGHDEKRQRRVARSGRPRLPNEFDNRRSWSPSTYSRLNGAEEQVVRDVTDANTPMAQAEMLLSEVTPPRKKPALIHLTRP